MRFLLESNTNMVLLVIQIIIEICFQPDLLMQLEYLRKRRGYNENSSFNSN